MHRLRETDTCRTMPGRHDHAFFEPPGTCVPPPAISQHPAGTAPPKRAQLPQLPSMTLEQNYERGFEESASEERQAAQLGAYDGMPPPPPPRDLKPQHCIAPAPLDLRRPARPPPPTPLSRDEASALLGAEKVMFCLFLPFAFVDRLVDVYGRRAERE